MFEINEETGKIDFTHNPFSMPQGEMEARNHESAGYQRLSVRYRLQRLRVSSGAVRNHRTDVMVKAFEIAGYDEDVVKQKFGALYNAFQYARLLTPAWLREWTVLSCCSPERRISGSHRLPSEFQCPGSHVRLTGEVTEQQLREVHIKVR